MSEAPSYLFGHNLDTGDASPKTAEQISPSQRERTKLLYACSTEMTAKKNRIPSTLADSFFAAWYGKEGELLPPRFLDQVKELRDTMLGKQGHRAMIDRVNEHQMNEMPLLEKYQVLLRGDAFMPNQELPNDMNAIRNARMHISTEKDRKVVLNEMLIAIRQCCTIVFNNARPKLTKESVRGVPHVVYGLRQFQEGEPYQSVQEQACTYGAGSDMGALWQSAVREPLLPEQCLQWKKKRIASEETHLLPYGYRMISSRSDHLRVDSLRASARPSDVLILLDPHSHLRTQLLFGQVLRHVKAHTQQIGDEAKSD
jgi:hypothetical protein